MTRRRLAIIFFFISLGVLIGFGTWWIMGNVGAHTLETGRHYYIRQMHSNFFLDDGGNRIQLQPNDESHLTFNEDFSAAEVYFTGRGIQSFVMTNSRVRSRRLEADMVTIIGGHLIRLHMVAANDFITIRSSLDYDVRIETPDQYGSFNLTISSDDVVLRFYRTPPPRITGPGGGG